MMTLFSILPIAAFGLFSLLGLNTGLFFRQLIYILLGFALYFFLRKIGARYIFKANARLIYWVMVAILAITYIIGLDVKGSKRWLDFYLFNFQASEFIKIFFILYMSEYLVDIKHYVRNFNYFLKAVAYVLIPGLIILKQPDLGNASLLFFIFFIMILNSKFPKKFILYALTFFIMFIPLGWFFLKSYQRERIASFFNPHVDTQGTAYNMIQSIITIGSGMFFGRGLGLGTQSRLYFLPENHTDFAFASLVEQFGFFGGLIVLIFFGLLIYSIGRRCIKYYFQQEDEGRKNFLLTLGIVSYIIFQVFLNIGMNLGLLPVAGIALPFISYGGSSILAFFLAIALLP